MCPVTLPDKATWKAYAEKRWPTIEEAKADGEPIRLETVGLLTWLQWLSEGHQPESRVLNYRDYLSNEHWQNRRVRALELAGYRCQQCGIGGCRLEVHHRNYDRLWHELDSDLIVLCSNCHAQIHGQESS